MFTTEELAKINGAHKAVFQRAADFIASFEGANRDADGYHVVYKCVAGKPTIGYGCTEERYVKQGRITEQVAQYLLMQVILRCDVYLTKLFGDAYTYMLVNQKVALISLVYNMGSLSTCPKLRQKIMTFDYENAVKEFADCDKIRTPEGKLTSVNGLTNRRKAEMTLWNTEG